MPAVVEVEKKAARVAAIILNWNAWADAIACAESLLHSSRPPDQIVLCDNGSIDGSLEYLHAWAREQGPCEFFASPRDAFGSVPTTAPLVVIAVGENGGYAAGNNIGMRYAISHHEADYVWILNSDVVVERDALAKMLDVAQSDARIAIVGAKLLRFDAPDTIQALGGGHIIPVLCHDTQLGSGRKSETSGLRPIEVDHLVGASLLVRSDAVRRVGLIDETYFLYREETDWCIRMRRDGWKLYCAADAIVWHKQSLSIGFKSPLHDYYAVRNMLHLVRKFYPASLPAAFSYFACRSLAPKVLRMERERIGAVLSALRDFIGGVTGRASQHSDHVLMRNYIERHARRTNPAKPAARRPAAATAAIVALIVTLAGAMAGAAVATVVPQWNHGPAIAEQPTGLPSRSRE